MIYQNIAMALNQNYVFDEKTHLATYTLKKEDHYGNSKRILDHSGHILNHFVDYLAAHHNGIIKTVMIP